jgi:hypothetical protein
MSMGCVLHSLKESKYCLSGRKDMYVPIVLFWTSNSSLVYSEEKQLAAIVDVEKREETWEFILQRHRNEWAGALYRICGISHSETLF